MTKRVANLVCDGMISEVWAQGSALGRYTRTLYELPKGRYQVKFKGHWVDVQLGGETSDGPMCWSGTLDHRPAPTRRQRNAKTKAKNP